MSDQAIIDEAVELFQAGEPIDDLQARVIANAWHGGQWSALYSLASTGHIDEALSDEIESELARSVHALLSDNEQSALQALLAYAQTNGPREPQAGWSNLHW